MMTKRITVALVLSMILAPAVWAHGDKHGDHHSTKSAFNVFMEHYEAIRLSLLSDSLDGVKGHARAISKQARRLGTAFDAEMAGVKPAESKQIQSLMPALRKQADALARAKSLDDARAAFGAISESLVTYRNAATGPRPAIAFCPMAKKSWLQPKGEIGNPYGGKKMPRCGQFSSN